MLRLILTAIVLALLTSPAPAQKKKPSRRGQIHYAKERNKQAAKDARRRAAHVQKQAKWKVKERRKQVKRMQSEQLRSTDRTLSKERKRALKDRQRMANRHKSVHVLDPAPDPKPDSTPKAKQRGMLGSAPQEDK